MSKTLPRYVGCLTLVRLGRVTLAPVPHKDRGTSCKPLGSRP